MTHETSYRDLHTAYCIYPISLHKRPVTNCNYQPVCANFLCTVFIRMNTALVAFSPNKFETCMCTYTYTLFICESRTRFPMCVYVIVLSNVTCYIKIGILKTTCLKSKFIITINNFIKLCSF